jgi:hypothetical protein
LTTRFVVSTNRRLWTSRCSILSTDPSFRPKSAAATLRIARIAAAGGGTPRVARALLADFPARFAGVAAAAALARHLGA